jgi:predicted ATPase/DNA-binding CsgD family transcriptional regulator
MAAGSLLRDAGISDREAEVLACLGDHLTNAQIAGRLYISVRTVESHVSALLRKLDVADRRELADLADALLEPEGPSSPDPGTASLPSPLTSFVGRSVERAALGGLLTEHRLVTAVGPGGVGKTRLALAVATDVSDRYPDGAWYVDLCPVTDAAMVGATVAGAFGFGEQPGRSPTDTVVAKLAAAEALVVLDNCEHLLDGVSTFAERLLTGCPRMTVLATSRGRLLVPHESVFPVPGLSLDDGPEKGDAVRLFVDRAAMAGWSSPYPADRGRIAHICSELDGIALSIELAAARIATLGLDGLEAGLGDQLGLLSGGPRLDDRHRSARAALDWSFGLLDATDRVVLRRASVFAAPFTSVAAATVTGFAPLLPGQVAGSLARLSDHNLLAASTGPEGTRYQMLETIRQYGAEQIDEVGEPSDVRGRHLRWCLATAVRLQAGPRSGAAFDEVADDLRAALGWAIGSPEHRTDAFDLAGRLARLAYARGKPNEAQQRFEEAASLATDPAAAAEALHLAAAIAWGRHVGNDAIRLFRAAADAARRAGDRHRAALELMNAAELVTNAPGIMSELAPGAERALLAEARELAAGDVHLEAAVLTVTTEADEFDPAYAELAERAVELAHRVGDARLESHALDQLTAVHLICAEYDEAVATVERRLRLLAHREDDIELAWECSDVLHMAPMVYLAAGDLEAARRYAHQRSELSFFREVDHLAVEWLLTTAAVAGDFDEAVLLAQRFRRGWSEAGRPPLGGIGFAPAAAAMVHGIRGDEEARLEWLGIGAEMRRVTEPVRGRQTIYNPAFEGMVALHRGEVDAALTLVAEEPESFKPWHDSAWRPWYTAVWAEAGVLAALPDRRGRLDRARFTVRANPIASAMVERAAAIDSGDRDGLLAAAVTLGAAGCRYQHARTLVLAGGDDRADGEALLEALGAAPMAV